MTSPGTATSAATPATETLVVELQDVDFAYFRKQPVLRRCDLRLGSGLTLLLGTNGCGKSTLLKLIAGVEKPDRGRLLIHGHDLWDEEVEARRCLAYLPEQPDLTPYATVSEILMLVARLRLAAGAKASASEIEARVSEALSLLGLEGLGARTVRQLSKGQRRRVILAAAQLGTPKLLLLDEPLDALDRRTRERTLSWIDDLCADGGSAVVVTHEIEPFVSKVRRVVTVHDGRVETISELPPSTDERLEVLERWARSES